MKLTIEQLKPLTAERKALLVRLAEIDRMMAAHQQALIVERREKRKPVGPARAPITNPDVAGVRDYARQHIGLHVQVFNNRRKNDRRVKILRGLTPSAVKVHTSALLMLLPHATVTLALPPRCHSIEDDRRCICVNLPL